MKVAFPIIEAGRYFCGLLRELLRVHVQAGVDLQLASRLGLLRQCLVQLENGAPWQLLQELWRHRTQRWKQLVDIEEGLAVVAGCLLVALLKRWVWHEWDAAACVRVERCGRPLLLLADGRCCAGQHVLKPVGLQLLRKAYNFI
jgi:hypothetical protein